MLEHGMRLELAVNNLDKEERHTLEAMRRFSGLDDYHDTDSSSSASFTFTLDWLFRVTAFNSTKDLYAVLTSLNEKGFVELEKSNNSNVANITLTADKDQLDTLELLSRTKTLEYLMDDKLAADKVVKASQSTLDARLLPLLDHVNQGGDFDTHVLGVWPTTDREGWTTIRVSNYYDETVEFPTVVVNSSDPVAALKEHSSQLFEKYGHHLTKQNSVRPKI
jgi:hypothetical protein